LIVWFTTNGMCVKNNTIIYVARASNSKRDCDVKALPILTCERSNMMTSVREERLRRMISIVACCRGAKLWAHAARDFRSQHMLQIEITLFTKKTVCRYLIYLKDYLPLGFCDNVWTYWQWYVSTQLLSKDLHWELQTQTRA